ncbi:stage V sporulation protein AA [Alkalithermobacter thermoalcaliphilus JW-YL-7 = DSM 7308]|uniref:Stage V sporulation protein AA n=1 Tax=Alkalithermobacter thermoalcaliphilus JW-YL-7 = DSM 7308 TaxID=1121328 RepID=A0A150FP76_CLOPD|nr:Stage V sporulation protein AA [[Clostridium] paradoxum JW-YL-7 = DSM 7308]SHK53648.1 stage V sporulation protein AA [[Clostridium] paradoxum JW-YL-7 = DSM 7308]
MKEIYLISKKNLHFPKDTKAIYLKDIFDIFPENLRQGIENIKIQEFEGINSEYYIISLGKIINKIKDKDPNIKINLMDNKDIMINFKSDKKDKTIFIRVLIVCIILFLGASMAIINFHSDVNMSQSHRVLYRLIMGKEEGNLAFLQIPYSIGIAVGVATFYNKILPSYSKSEPSPLELEVETYKSEIESYIINKSNNKE